MNMSLERTAITQLMRELEAEYNVVDWKYNGWHAWPLLRAGLSFSLYSHKRSAIRRLASRVRNFPAVRRVRRLCSSFSKGEAMPAFPAGSRIPIVILDSYSIQPCKSGGCLYPYRPLLEKLSSWKIDAGIVRYGPYQANEELLPYPHIRWNRGPTKLLPIRIEWMHEHKNMMAAVVRQTGVQLSEFDWCILGSTELEAQCFQRLFENVDAKALLVTCWYQGRGFAASLAASRCGIQSIDVQHGTHDAGHFAYSGWTTAPAGGYELVPDLFWCWSQETARQFQEHNPGLTASVMPVVGGNLWINQNAQSVISPDRHNYEKARSLASQQERNIAVCMTGHLMAQLPDLLSLFRQSPRKWQWWLRIHRVMQDQLPKITAMLKANGISNVDWEFSNSLSLYELFTLCDTVVSDWSTCAQEALAFGKPVLLIHPTGRKTYSEAVDSGCMLYCDRKDAWLSALQTIRNIPSAKLREFSRLYFESSEIVEENLRSLFSVC